MKKIFKNISLIIMSVIFVISLTGCGKKGALVIDEKDMNVDTGVYNVDDSVPSDDSKAIGSYTNDNGETVIKREVTAKGDFLMAISDVFTISEKGTTVTGKIERGTIHVGDKVEIIGLGKETITTEVKEIERNRKLIDSAEEGEEVGILIPDVSRASLDRGQVLAKVGSIKSHTKFELKVTKTEDFNEAIEGKFNAQFYIRTTDVSGSLIKIGDDEIINPKDNEEVLISVELIRGMALEEGTIVSVRSKGQTLLEGTVTKVIE